MPKVLVSNNSELLRHLAAAPFRHLALELVTASSGDEALYLRNREAPALAILDAELAGVSGYQVAQQIKEESDCRVVLVLGKRINAEQMRRVSKSGCDEVLIAPMSADELYDVVAIQLGLPRRGTERFSVQLTVREGDDRRPVDGRVTNLSVDGARLVVAEPLVEGTRLELIISEADAKPITVAARVVWAQPHERKTVVGAAFDELEPRMQSVLARLTQWDLVKETERTRIVLKGDFTEATAFDDLLPVLVGRIDFDLSQVRYLNSLGVRAWCELIRAAPIHGYEFHACSIPFVLQASLVPDVLGRGSVTSFFAPYACEVCEHQEERLLQAATILAAEDMEPPPGVCPECGGQTSLDDIPERYLAFLRQDDE